MMDWFFQSLFMMSKFSVQVLHTFPRFPRYLNYITTKIHLNHCKDSPCVFNLSFFLSSFYHWSSSWRLYMMVHQGLNSFSKCSSRFFSEELKYSSSCISKFNPFSLIFWGGVMSFLIISLRVSWSTSYQEWDILKPLISSLELSFVRFHLKPSLRNVAIMVLIIDPCSSFIVPVK